MNNKKAIRILQGAKECLWDGEGKVPAFGAAYHKFACLAVEKSAASIPNSDKERRAITTRITELIGGYMSLESYHKYERKGPYENWERQLMRQAILDTIIKEYEQENKCKPFTKLSSLFNKLKARLKSKQS